MDMFGYYEQPASSTLTFSNSSSMVSDGWMDINISTYICLSIISRLSIDHLSMDR